MWRKGANICNDKFNILQNDRNSTSNRKRFYLWAMHTHKYTYRAHRSCILCVSYIQSIIIMIFTYTTVFSHNLWHLFAS